MFLRRTELTLAITRDPKWPIFLKFCFVLVSIETFNCFLGGGKIFVRINEFHFASNAMNFIGFGLNVSLVEILKVI